LWGPGAKSFEGKVVSIPEAFAAANQAEQTTI
jgi:hypothetical protein